MQLDVLPDSNGAPTCPLQAGGGLSVAFPISGQFRAPVGRVRLGSRTVERAAVPEASIEKDSHLRASEDDVDDDRPTVVDAEPRVGPEA
jgi:hypothetical protein